MRLTPKIRDDVSDHISDIPKSHLDRGITPKETVRADRCRQGKCGHLRDRVAMVDATGLPPELGHKLDRFEEAKALPCDAGTAPSRPAPYW